MSTRLFAKMLGWRPAPMSDLICQYPAYFEMVASMSNSKQVIEETDELQKLTGDAQGAHRVAWTAVWDTARTWFDRKFDGLPVTMETDAAGNRWVTLAGRSDDVLVIGSHLDSVYSGGRLDGWLGLAVGKDVLVALAKEGPPPVTVRLVDWADEEGARFGRSLFGSSAATGVLDPKMLETLVDRDGVKLTDAIGNYGLKLETLRDSSRQLSNVKAYLELHIEQGPVLERMALPLAAVLGTVGIMRHAIRFTGQAAHAGTTPMVDRRDALAPAAKLAIEIRSIAQRHGGVCTIGSVVTKPGMSSAVVGECNVLLEQRHLDAAALVLMVGDALEATERFAAEERVTVEYNKIWEISPIPFHAELIEFADEAIREVVGKSHRMPSGALHDASPIAQFGIPTVMMFVQSLRGLSHCKEEETKPEHLVQSVEAFHRLVEKTIAWMK